MVLSLRLLLCFTLLSVICTGSLAANRVVLDQGLESVSSESDARLDQKVTYEARHQTVKQIVDDLSQMTGVKLAAGASVSDWQLRSRKMNIFVKDVRLFDLMKSIERTMKFRWSVNNRTEPPSYRLKVDKKAAEKADALMKRAEEEKEKLWRKRRQEWIDAIMQYGSMPLSELESLSGVNSRVMREARLGSLQAIRALFADIPEAKRLYANGQSFRISVDKLSPETKSLLYAAGNEFWKHLQEVGAAPKNGDHANGYGDLLKLDDQFDVVLSRLDVGTFTPNLRWGPGTRSATGYLHFQKGKQDCEITALKYLGMENEDPQKDPQKEEEFLYPSEPLIDHLADPELDKIVKLKIEQPKNYETAVSEHITSFQKALSEAAGLDVVSDSWVNISGDIHPNQEAKLSELLDQFAKEFNYNWDKSSGILEFRHRKWWKNRNNQIPDEWIATWRESTIENRRLSLDHLAQIANLTYEQAEESMKQDHVLGITGFYKELLSILDRNGVLPLIRLYSGLNSQQRQMLMSEQGLDGHLLSEEQWKQVQPLLDRFGSSRSNAVIRLVDTSDSYARYLFQELDGISGEVDRTWDLYLPRYEPPAVMKTGKN